MASAAAASCCCFVGDGYCDGASSVDRVAAATASFDAGANDVAVANTDEEGEALGK